MDILELTADQTHQANRRYDQIGFQTSRPEQDRTFGIRSTAGEWIGLGRIQKQGDDLELGGFWVAEDQRGKGLARELVQRVLEELDPGVRAYCVPFEHLVNFYASFGMEPLEPDEAPDAIRAKARYCETMTRAGVYSSKTRLLVYEKPR